jgi:hypothetical protein
MDWETIFDTVPKIPARTRGAFAATFIRSVMDFTWKRDLAVSYGKGNPVVLCTKLFKSIYLYAKENDWEADLVSVDKTTGKQTTERIDKDTILTHVNLWGKTLRMLKEMSPPKDAEEETNLIASILLQSSLLTIVPVVGGVLETFGSGTAEKMMGDLDELSEQLNEGDIVELADGMKHAHTIYNALMTA